MKKKLLVFLAVLLMMGQSLTAQTTNDSDITAWFQEARYGMFVHFGLYSIPGGVWNGEKQARGMYAEWIHKQGNWPELISTKEYKKLLKEFNPVNFNADEWIKTAKEAGMKYFLITAKHHDGFALWPSKVSKYNVVHSTRFKRDILGELAAACEKYDIVLGFYYSHWQDWDEGGAQPPQQMMLSPNNTPQVSHEQFDKYWTEKCIPQVKELMLNYKPKFWWFDTWRPTEMIDEAKVYELIKAVKDIDPTCLINSRIQQRMEGIWDKVDYISMWDNQFPTDLLTRAWETSGTLNHSFGYSKIDYSWKSAGELLTSLVSNANYNGNFQLNIGPKPDGTFDKASLKRLKDVGAWLESNGEAIYDTEPNIIGKQDWGFITMREKEDGKTRLYLHVIEPESYQEIKLKLKYFPSRKLKVHMLETEQELPWEPYIYQGIVFDMPKYVVDQNISVVVVDLDVNYKAKMKEVEQISKMHVDE